MYDQRVNVDAQSPAAPSTVRTQVVNDYEAFCAAIELLLATEPSAQMELLFDDVDIVRKKYAPLHRHKLDGSNTSVEKIPDQAYFGGKPITPIGRTFYQTGTETIELKFTIDYEVSYKNNTDVGQATLIVHGKGKYTGQVATTFYITRTN
jgi:hypothetical protein